MQTNKTIASIGIAAMLVFAINDVAAAKPVPASLAEMWKIIQQQQREIEALKAKAGENELLKQEVKTLQEAQKGDAKPQPQAVAAPATAVGENSAAGQPQSAVAAKSLKSESETERKTNILATELEKIKTQLFIPDKREYKVEYGYGPAASEVYRVNRGLSIGGYGEAVYTNYTANKDNRKDSADLLRGVLYIGYKFNDWIVLNNEIEFEHGTTKEDSTGRSSGEVSVEFSQLDFFLHKNANIRAGLMLMPMGFINEIHEPTTFHGNYRPEVERYIIPTTWRELGAGLFGEITPEIQYRMYAVNGLRADRYTSGGVRDGRQNGSKALAENWAFTGRLDYTPNLAPGLLVGASAFMGDAGQDKLYARQQADVFTQLYEGHIQWHYKGLEFRTLGAYGNIGNAGLVSAQNNVTVGGENFGVYTELAYDVMPHLWKDTTQYLAPFFRYERYNTLASVPDGFRDDRTWDRWIYQAGLTYKPIQNVAVKLDYKNVNSNGGGLPHELNLGFGFMY
ncbi:MAG: hypothetical protein WCI11_17305 [Candidatus Methylumidiphilus sp.]